MQPVYYRKGLLRLVETWYQEPQPQLDADIVRCMQVPVQVAGACCEPFNTLMIDLTAESGTILARMDKGTRYEVRRAEGRDAIRRINLPARQLGDLRDFIAAYDSSLVSRNRALRLNLVKLGLLAEGGYLDVSTMIDQAVQVLTWHVHILAAPTVRLLYSVSLGSQTQDPEHRNRCGRANRLHHWLDMQQFKQAGYRKYDFGGFYAGADDAKKLQINKFKQGFGGEPVLTYNCLYPLTLKGRVALAAWRILRKGEQ